MCTIIQHVHFQGTSTLTRCNIECVCVPTFKEDPYVVESHMCARSRNATTHPANTLKYAVHVNMYFASSNMSFLTCQGMSRTNKFCGLCSQIRAPQSPPRLLTQNHWSVDLEICFSAFVATCLERQYPTTLGALQVNIVESWINFPGFYELHWQLILTTNWIF